ncbi:MAG: polysaccharide export protein [Candidatus Omnitrophica bacterium]|nr:polysaccharide export protein [Candidatus Omnitrophota bacterium]
MKKSIKILLIGSFFFLLTCPAFSAKDEAGSEYYKIAAGDNLEIVVYEEEDLSGQFEVKEDGTITFPLVGPVHVVGLAKKEAEDKLRALLKDGYLVDPYVRIIVGKFGTRNILIVGHVGRPGSYPLPEDGNPTILKAIVESGGFTQMADPNGTRIIRTAPGGKKVTINPRIGDIMSGRRQDISLEPGDLIVVPERLF